MILNFLTNMARVKNVPLENLARPSKLQKSQFRISAERTLQNFPSKCQGKMKHMTFFVIQGSEGRERNPLAPGVRFPAMLTFPSRGRSPAACINASMPAMVSYRPTTGKEENHASPSKSFCCWTGEAPELCWPGSLTVIQT